MMNKKLTITLSFAFIIIVVMAITYNLGLHRYLWYTGYETQSYLLGEAVWNIDEPETIYYLVLAEANVTWRIWPDSLGSIYREVRLFKYDIRSKINTQVGLISNKMPFKTFGLSPHELQQKIAIVSPNIDNKLIITKHGEHLEIDTITGTTTEIFSSLADKNIKVRELSTNKYLGCIDGTAIAIINRDGNIVQDLTNNSRDQIDCKATSFFTNFTIIKDMTIDNSGNIITPGLKDKTLVNYITEKYKTRLMWPFLYISPDIKYSQQSSIDRIALNAIEAIDPEASSAKYEYKKILLGPIVATLQPSVVIGAVKISDLSNPEFPTMHQIYSNNYLKK